MTATRFWPTPHAPWTGIRRLRLGLSIALSLIVAGGLAAASASAATTTTFGPTGGDPRSIVVDATGTMFVSDDEGVLRIAPDGAMRRYAPYSALNGIPFALAFGPDGSLYTAFRSQDRVSRITPAGEVVPLPGRTGKDPRALLVTDDGVVYTANAESNDVTRIDPSGESNAFAETGANPVGIVIDTAGRLFTANRSDDSVTRISGPGTSTRFALTGTYPVEIAIDAGGTLFTANNVGQSMSVIAPNGVSRAIRLGGAPIAVVVDGDGNTYLPMRDRPQRVVKVNAVGAAQTLAAVGVSPSAIALDTAANVYVTNSRDQTVTRITQARYPLARSGAGAGSGSITATPAGVDCGPDCSTYTEFTYVTLTATPNDAAQFVGWGGACSGTQPTCSVTMEQAADVEAQFEPIPGRPSILEVAHEGAGVVTSTPAGIECGADCRQAFPVDERVVLTATPGEGAFFAGWDGACQGRITSCVVTMSEDKQVTAIFKALPPRSSSLAISRSGSGAGTVNSTPAGIDCGVDCVHKFVPDTTVSLVAEPADGAYFVGWGGACAGTGSTTCVVTMTRDLDVSVEFAPLPPRAATLEVTRTGSGGGEVFTEPAGIACGADCTQGFPRGTLVRLTATPDEDSRLGGWSGDCIGTSRTCLLAMSGDATATATFIKLPPSANDLAIIKRGSGDGRIISTPAGIDCGPDCTQGFLDTTTVTLTVMPDNDTRFVGWGGACAGAQPTCTTTMAKARTVTATFAELPANSPTLIVTNQGTGQGVVTSTPVGIDCGTNCRQDYRRGTTVTLTASPQADSRFTSWSGACTGTTRTCILTLDRDHRAQATFTRTAELTNLRPRITRTTLAVTSQLRTTTQPSRITQRATTTGKTPARCRTIRALTTTKPTRITCTLGKKARNALKTRPLKLRITTTITTPNQPKTTLRTTLTIPRTR